MGVTRLSFAALPLSHQGLGSSVTDPGGSLPYAKLQSGVKTAALLAENSSHRLGWCTKETLSWLQCRYVPHQIWLSCVLSQSFNSVLMDLAVLNTSLQRCTMSHYPQAAQSTALCKNRQLHRALRRRGDQYRAQGPGPETCPYFWEKSFLGAAQNAGEGAGMKLALEKPVNSPGSGFINASLYADQEQKH